MPHELTEAGYSVTGVDRDRGTIARADARVPGATTEGDRQVPAITYVDGTVMDFELFEPDELAARAATRGSRVLEACCWWDERRTATAGETRYQMVLERTRWQVGSWRPVRFPPVARGARR